MTKNWVIKPAWRSLTLCIKTEGGGTDTAFRYADENGIGGFYWIDRDFGYALSGNLDKSRLLEVAKVASRLGLGLGLGGK